MMSNDNFLENPWEIGDIIFVRSYGLTAKLNIFFQNLLTMWKYSKQKQYSHVFLSLGDGLFAESTTHKGVHIFSVCELKEMIEAKYDKDYKIFRNIDVSNNKELQRKIFIETEYFLGQKYNKFFILAQKARKGHSYCSEFVSNVYKTINIFFKDNKFPRDIFPNHLFFHVSNNNDEWIEVTYKLNNMFLDSINNYDSKLFNDICSTKKKQIEYIILHVKQSTSIHIQKDYVNYYDLTYKFFSSTTSSAFNVNMLIMSTTMIVMNEFKPVVAKLYKLLRPYKLYSDSKQILIETIRSIEAIGEKYQDLNYIITKNEKDIRFNYNAPSILEIKKEIQKDINFNKNIIQNMYKQTLMLNSSFAESLNTMIFNMVFLKEGIMEDLLPIVSQYSLCNNEITEICDICKLSDIEQIYKEVNRKEKYNHYKQYLDTVIAIINEIAFKNELIKYFLNIENNLNIWKGIKYLVSMLDGRSCYLEQLREYHEIEQKNDNEIKIKIIIYLYDIFIELYIYQYIYKMATEIQNKELQKIVSVIIEEKSNILSEFGIDTKQFELSFNDEN